jgi:hypothetical protein
MGDSEETTGNAARPGYEPFPVNRRKRTWLNGVDGRLRRKLPAPVYRPLLATHHGLRTLARKNPGRGRLLPDFVIIGAAKAGTTSLYAWLCEHPCVERARAKEIHYFSYYHYRGADWYRHHFPLREERDAFATERGRPFLTGEASPSYMLDDRAPQRMAALIPDVKLIVQVRDPVDRAYSQFQMRRRDGEEPISSFAAALEREDPTFAATAAAARAARALDPEGDWRTYLRRGRYAEQLVRWFEYFPRDQFHVVAMEDLAANPERSLNDVHEFLGLPPHRPDELKPLYTFQYDPMPPETRRRLVEYFKPHNERLSELLGRDFAWEH